MHTKNTCVMKIIYILNNFYMHIYMGASLVAQLIKNPPAMWETWVQSLGWEDLLEKGMAIHSSIPAWRILMDSGAWQVTGYGVCKELDMTK